MFKNKNSRRQPKTSVQRSGPTYSYYSNNNMRGEERKSSRQVTDLSRPKKPRLSWWHHTPTVIAGFIIVFSLFYALSLNSNPIVVQPGGQKNIFLQPINTYKDAAHKLFAQSIFNKNKITVDVSGVTSQLKKQFPELTDVTVTLPLISHRPVVYITPSQPTMIINGKNGSFILNENGVAILKTSVAKDINQLNLPVVTDQSNLTIQLGKGVIPKESVNFIYTVYGQLNAQKISIKTLVLPPLANELDITLNGQSYFTKMDMQGSAKEETGTLLATENYLNTHNQPPSTYIDVRIAGRAYFK